MLHGVKKGDKGDVIEAKDWRQIACGGQHTVGVTTTGDLYSWGRGDEGQLDLDMGIMILLRNQSVLLVFVRVARK